MTLNYPEQYSSSNSFIQNAINDRLSSQIKPNNSSSQVFRSSNQIHLENNIEQYGNFKKINKLEENQTTKLPTQNLFCQTLLDNSISSPLRNSISTLPQPELNRISRFFQANGCNTQKDFFVKEIPDGLLKHQSSILHFHSKNNYNSSKNECRSTKNEIKMDQQVNENSTNYADTHIMQNNAQKEQEGQSEIEKFYKEKYYKTKEKYQDAKKTIALLQSQLQQASLHNQEKSQQVNQKDAVNEQIIEIGKKYQTLKDELNQSKEIIENQKLKIDKSNDDLEKCTAKINKSKDIIEKQTLKINKSKAIIEKQNIQINKYKTAIEKQNLQIKKLKVAAEKQNHQISQLQNKISELLLNTNSSNKNNSSIHNSTETINTSVKESSLSPKRGHVHFKGSFKAQTKRSSSALGNYHHHFELTPHPIKQYKYLCNMLNVDSDEFDQQWNKVFRKVADLLNSIAAKKQTSNPKNKHFSISFNLDTTEKRKIYNKKANDDDRLYEMDLLRKQYDNISKKFETLQLSLKFGNLISKFNSKLYKDVEDLHSSVTMKKHSHFREVILTVIFAHRMLNNIKSESLVNVKSLAVFKERPYYSPDILIRDIRSKFTSLSQDLVYSQHLASQKH